MGMKLSDYKSREKKLEIDFDGEKLQVWYYPGAYTPEMEAKARLMSEGDQEAGRHLYEMLHPVIARWDLTDDDEKVIELSPETFQQIPFSITIRVLEAIATDLNPQEGNAKRSGSFSTRAN